MHFYKSRTGNIGVKVDKQEHHVGFEIIINFSVELDKFCNYDLMNWVGLIGFVSPAQPAGAGIYSGKGISRRK